MMASDYIIDVTEADFEYQVLAYSNQTPVVVDFWAEWCNPCRVLGPILEKLALEAQGDFRLAKVNVDENPNLALRYAVRSIPAVKTFRNGEMIKEFIGMQPEPRLREFIRSIAPSQSDLALERGFSLLNLDQPKSAETAFREVLEDNPESASALIGLAKSLLIQGQFQESHLILKTFPPSREFHVAEMLLPLAQAMVDQTAGKYEDSDHVLDPAFNNAIRLVKRGNILAAMDGLLDILREDKNYRQGLSRKIMIALLELLGEENTFTAQYRNELASILF